MSASFLFYRLLRLYGLLLLIWVLYPCIVIIFVLLWFKYTLLDRVIIIFSLLILLIILFSIAIRTINLSELESLQSKCIYVLIQSFIWKWLMLIFNFFLLLLLLLIAKEPLFDSHRHLNTEKESQVKAKYKYSCYTCRSCRAITILLMLNSEAYNKKYSRE